MSIRAARVVPGGAGVGPGDAWMVAGTGGCCGGVAGFVTEDARCCPVVWRLWLRRVGVGRVACCG